MQCAFFYRETQNYVNVTPALRRQGRETGQTEGSDPASRADEMTLHLNNPRRGSIQSYCHVRLSCGYAEPVGANVFLTGKAG